MEMQRILENADWIATSSLKWDSVVDKIVGQADLEAEHCKAVREKIREMSECGMVALLLLYCSYICIYICSVENNHIMAFTLLPLLLPDARTKPDSEKVIYFTEVL